MEPAQLTLSLKAVNEDGTFSGLAAVYSNRDAGGDVILPGAFTKSLAAKSELPILWQHDVREPIGVGQLSDSDQGLAITGKLVLESDVARKAYALMKAGAVKGLSIGYQIVHDGLQNGVRVLQELKLHEVSVVTFAMNPRAQVMAVKEEIQPCAAKGLVKYL
jgi:HK97 family phage prohead protease